MDQVTKVDDLTVKVTTKTPWKAFPAYLYLDGRAGIMAPAQLATPPTCATNMIGTGSVQARPPHWKVNESLKVVEEPRLLEEGRQGQRAPVREPDHVRADPRLAHA